VVRIGFSLAAVADEVRECTHTTTCYVIDGVEL
jgi:hypothetical protein